MAAGCAGKCGLEKFKLIIGFAWTLVASTMALHIFHEAVVNRDGTVFYVATANLIQAFDVKTGAVLHKFEAENQTANEGGSGPEKPQSEIRNHLNLLKLVDNDNFLICSQNEQKSVIVFSKDLKLVSRRQFPKRPSAINVLTSTSDGSLTLFVGDKFGDVYTVPLQSNDAIGTDPEPALGHVSMLVDVVAAEYQGRQYVISADRDEHIRVTRYPQTFVIERWLFGHTEFVSSIVVVPWQKELLVSGGGDDFLAVWNWTTGELLSKFELREVVLEHLNQSHEGKGKDGKTQKEISVNKIMSWQGMNGTELIFVHIEGTGLLLSFKLVDGHLLLLGKLVHDKNIVSATVDNNGVCYITVDDDSLAASYQVDINGAFSKRDDSICRRIAENGSIDFATSGVNIVALYNVRQLRKRGEY